MRVVVRESERSTVRESIARDGVGTKPVSESNLVVQQ